jgi:hypothetical protein
MKTIRFYDILTETSTGLLKIMKELRLTMPEDINMTDMLDVLSQHTGFNVESFSYETVEVDN